MKIFKILAVVALMAVSASAYSATEVSGDVGLYSDYIWRGISQTNGGSATQANLTVDVNKFYISAFTSNADLADARYELDLSAGFANSVNNFDYDVGAVTYLYPGDVSDLELDTWEVYGGGTYNFNSQAGIGAKVSYSDDYFGTGTSWYTEVPLTFSSQYFDAMGAVGYLNLNDADVVKHTTDYKVAVTGHVTKQFDVYGQWTKLSPATDDFDLPTDFKDGTWVGGIAYNF